MPKKHPKNPGVAFSLNDFSKTHSICVLQMQLENPDYPLPPLWIRNVTVSQTTLS